MLSALHMAGEDTITGWYDHRLQDYKAVSSWYSMKLHFSCSLMIIGTACYTGWAGRFSISGCRFGSEVQWWAGSSETNNGQGAETLHGNFQGKNGHLWCKTQECIYSHWIKTICLFITSWALLMHQHSYLFFVRAARREKAPLTPSLQ